MVSNDLCCQISLTNNCLKTTLHSLVKHHPPVMKSTLLFIVLAATLTACGGKQTAVPVNTMQPALTQLVGVSEIDSNRQYSGEVRARHEVELGFRIGGKIIERKVVVGEQVKAGEVLARLDSADARLQAGAAKAQLQLARQDAQRYRELHLKGFVSQSALDVKEVTLQVSSAQAGLADNQLDYTTLRAGHDGVIAAVLAEAGQVVSAGQPVLRLVQSGEREVAIEIPESQWSLYHEGDAAQVFIGVDAPVAGFLRELSHAADPASRSYAARVAFIAQQPALGMTARVQFVIKHDAQTDFLIPLTAIYQQGMHAAVWIVAADHRVSLRQVKIKSYRDEGAVITGGLHAGERIVSAGVHRLTRGEKIQQIDSGIAQ